MQVKVLEVHDRNTFIPMLCVEMSPDNRAGTEEKQRYLLRRCGYPCDSVELWIVMTRLNADNALCVNDPRAWRDRTFATAHKYIVENWEKLDDGSVVDIEYILGESVKPKLSERLTTALPPGNYVEDPDGRYTVVIDGHACRVKKI